MREREDKKPQIFRSLDSYLFYCCPECDHKYKSKPSFINHAFSSHPDAKHNLKYEETTEDIVIKSDVNIKEENDIIENSNEFDNKEPENDIIENEEELDDYNNESLDWYEPEVYEESFVEDPPKKKRGRPPKHKIEGTIYHLHTKKYNLYCQKCNFWIHLILAAWAPLVAFYISLLARCFVAQKNFL